MGSSPTGPSMQRVDPCGRLFAWLSLWALVLRRGCETNTSREFGYPVRPQKLVSRTSADVHSPHWAFQYIRRVGTFNLLVLV